jgi:hypothetical protein
MKKGSWKGDAVQRGLETGSRKLSTVRSRYQVTAGEDSKQEVA